MDDVFNFHTLVMDVAVVSAVARFKSFNAQFEELLQRQSQWTVHDDLRESLRLMIAELVLPAYRSFTKRFGYAPPCRIRTGAGGRPKRSLSRVPLHAARAVLRLSDASSLPFFLSSQAAGGRHEEPGEVLEVHAGGRRAADRRLIRGKQPRQPAPAKGLIGQSIEKRNEACWSSQVGPSPRRKTTPVPGGFRVLGFGPGPGCPVNRPGRAGLGFFGFWVHPVHLFVEINIFCGYIL